MGLELFFSPKSIAVVGASNKPEKVGYSLAKHLQNFNGQVYFVNKNNETIFGKDSYYSLKDIKSKVDLCIIAVPAEFVKFVVHDCGVFGIKNVIIISAGFSEIGEKKEEAEILLTAKKFGIRIMGPNCFGVVNTTNGLNCTFAKSDCLKGNVGFISQSGALWSYIADYSVVNYLGFSKFASIGDMMDVGFEELAEYFENDKDTKVILLYIETLRDGKSFMDVISKCKKPVVVVKAGKTESGVKAASSHTGSLAGSYEVYKAALKQAGAYFVDDLISGLDLVKVLSCYNDFFKGSNGFKNLIITNAGGPGILMADALECRGLEVVKLPNINFNLPPAWSHGNPIDVLGDADDLRFKEVFSKLRKKNFFDNLIVVLTPQDMTDDKKIAYSIVNFHRSSGKKVFCCFMGFKSFSLGRRILEENKIPCFDNPERIGNVLRYLKR